MSSPSSAAAAAAVNPALRREVIAIYKELLYLGKDWYEKPSRKAEGFIYFRPRLHRAFMSRAHLRDEAEIRHCIDRAHYARKEIETL